MNINDIEELAQEYLSTMEKEAGIKEVGSKLLGHAKRYGELMKGGKKMTFATGSKTRAVDKIHTAKRPGNTAGGYKPGEHGNAEARKEALKSLAARAGTAAVAGGAGLAAKKKMDKK